MSSWLKNEEEIRAKQAYASLFCLIWTRSRCCSFLRVFWPHATLHCVPSRTASRLDFFGLNTHPPFSPHSHPQTFDRRELRGSLLRNSNFLFKKVIRKKQFFAYHPLLLVLQLAIHMSEYANAGQVSIPSRVLLPKQFLGR